MKEFLFKSKTFIILDNGHGIDTPGKRSPVWSDGTQLFEYEFTRDIVEKMSGLLTVLNISHCILVPEINDIPLEDRVARVNELKNLHKDKFVYLVSIHGNAAPNRNANGIEVWTSKGHTTADLLAKEFYNSLKYVGWRMRPNNSIELDKEKDFLILKKTKCPAVLTENGFYTNEEECKKMMEFFWRDRIAIAHVNAIKNIEQTYGRSK